MEEDVKPIRIAVVGDGAVGKTFMLFRYVFDELPIDYEPTVFENYGKLVNVDGKRYSLQLFDTSGQEDYDRLRVLSYTDRDCIIICFAINSIESLENVKSKWINDVRSANKKAKVLLVGTKCDLRTENANVELIEENRAVKIKKSIGAKGYMECSALKNEGVQSVFAEATRIVIRKWEKKNKRKRCTIL